MSDFKVVKIDGRRRPTARKKAVGPGHQGRLFPASMGAHLRVVKRGEVD